MKQTLHAAPPGVAKHHHLLAAARNLHYILAYPETSKTRQCILLTQTPKIKAHIQMSLIVIQKSNHITKHTPTKSSQNNKFHPTHPPPHHPLGLSSAHTTQHPTPIELLPSITKPHTTANLH